jgi:predicted PurR-regulated permease PerM
VDAGARTSLSWPEIWRRTILAAAGIGVLIFLTLIPKTVEIFIVATLIAYGINPMVHWLRRRMPRAAAIAVVYVGLVAAVLIASVIIIPNTVNQLQVFFGNGPSYLTAVQHFFDGVQKFVAARFGQRVLPPQLQDIEGHAVTQIGALLNSALSSAGNLVLGIANVLVIGITAVILSYYLLSHAAEIRDSFYSLFPERSQERARTFTLEVGRVVGGFIFGQLVLSAFSGIATFVVLSFTPVSQYALLLGVLTGLFYAVPYLGIFAAMLLGALLGAPQGWQVALLAAGVIFGVTRISDYVLVPKIMSESVGISPMAIIFAVFAGGELFGLWGLVLAIPEAAIFKVAWRVWLHPWLTGKAIDLPTRTASPERST